MRPPLTQDNQAVAQFLEGYFSANEACRAHPWLDDILSGVLALRTGGDSRTRSMSRKVLFLLLQRCDVVSTQEARKVLQRRYEGRTIERYASLARVASRAIAKVIPVSQSAGRDDDRNARAEVDAGWQADLERALTDPPRAAAEVYDPMRVHLEAGRRTDAAALAGKRLAHEHATESASGSYAEACKGLRNLRRDPTGGESSFRNLRRSPQEVPSEAPSVKTIPADPVSG